MDSKNINSDPCALTDVITKNKRCICTTVTGFLFIIMVIISVIVDPVAQISRYCVKIDNGTKLYKTLQEKIDSISIKMYLFNITNTERFVAGLDHQLKLQEVGPFTFREARYNTDMELDSNNRILRYTPFSNLTFVPEESIGDPKEVAINAPNIMFLAFASQLSRESFIVKTGFEILSIKQRSKAIMTVTVHEYLWGYEDQLTAIASTLMPGVVYYSRLGLLSFAFHPKRNVRLELDTRDENKFQVITSNGVEGIVRLGYLQNRSYCNSFEDAYEGLIFPMNMSPKRKIRIYHPFFCRFMELDYIQNKTLDDGTDTLEYEISKHAYDNRSEHQCLCHTGKCFKGLSDMSPCFDGLPLYLSHGHFLNAEPRVFERLEGLKPDPEKHGSQFLIHKNIGLTVKSHLTAQVNIVMGNMNFSSAARPFSNMIIPFVWVKIEQLPLPENITTLLKVVGLYLPKITIALQVVLVLLGTCLLIYTCRIIQTNTYSGETEMEYCKQSFEKGSNIEEKLNFTNQVYEKQTDNWKSP